MWHVILGISKDSSKEEIERAYKRLSNSKKYKNNLEKSVELHNAYRKAIESVNASQSASNEVIEEVKIDLKADFTPTIEESIIEKEQDLVDISIEESVEIKSDDTHEETSYEIACAMFKEYFTNLTIKQITLLFFAFTVAMFFLFSYLNPSEEVSKKREDNKVIKEYGEGYRFGDAITTCIENTEDENNPVAIKHYMQSEFDGLGYKTYETKNGFYAVETDILYYRLHIKYEEKEGAYQCALYIEDRIWHSDTENVYITVELVDSATSEMEITYSVGNDEKREKFASYKISHYKVDEIYDLEVVSQELYDKYSQSFDLINMTSIFRVDISSIEFAMHLKAYAK